MVKDDPKKLDKRYKIQSGWSKPFREYLYDRLNRQEGIRVLEVGSGTGAILDCVQNEFGGRINLSTGIDFDLSVVKYAAVKNNVRTIVSNAEELPFEDGSFDFVSCHFLLLWVKDPVAVLREMKRVTVENGICAALAEPCYDEMSVEPMALFELADRQRQIIAHRGAEIGIGSRLGELFRSAGFSNIEWGRYQSGKLSPEDLRNEIRQMEEDTGLSCLIGAPVEKMKYEIPTYFAFAKKEQKEK